MLIGGLLLLGGIILVLWGAERFTDGAIRTAIRFSLSPFYVGAIVSGFEPENLITGGAAALGGLSQVALGTVIGAAIFMLTAGLGLTLLMLPMPVNIPRAGGVAMLLCLGPFAGVLWNDSTVSRPEGALLVVIAVSLMLWLYRQSPVFLSPVRCLPTCVLLPAPGVRCGIISAPCSGAGLTRKREPKRNCLPRYAVEGVGVTIGWIDIPVHRKSMRLVLR